MKKRLSKLTLTISLTAIALYCTAQFMHQTRPKGMVWIPGGEFMMGSDTRLAKVNERPAHKVRE